LRILFIGNSRIGDFILSSGLLAHLIDHHRDARITVVCGKIIVPLLAHTPNIERIIVLEKRKHHRHWLDLWLMAIGTRWDLVIDLRNSAVSHLVLARKVRRVERARADPRLWMGDADRNAAAGLIPAGPPSWLWVPVPPTSISAGRRIASRNWQSGSPGRAASCPAAGSP
jgi:heptosyltransferase III